MRKGICEWDRSYLGRGEEGSVRKKSEARKAQYRPGGAIYVADPPRHTWIFNQCPNHEVQKRFKD